jgi:hypothetical protein
LRNLEVGSWCSSTRRATRALTGSVIITASQIDARDRQKTLPAIEAR